MTPVSTLVLMGEEWGGENTQAHAYCRPRDGWDALVLHVFAMLMQCSTEGGAKGATWLQKLYPMDLQTAAPQCERDTREEELDKGRIKEMHKEIDE